MQFQIPIQIKPISPGINYRDKILLTGSCFTEHIGNHLQHVKLDVLQNPNGILFDNRSVCNSLISYMENKQYSTSDLFSLHEAWHSWAHHSRFSNIEADEAIYQINNSQQNAHEYLKQANWLIITLGSAFSYQLINSGEFVANCHKAPAQEFKKHLNSIDEIITSLDGMLYRLFKFNTKIKVIFTISPVRHIRDGIVENNLSKARLLEAVHHMVNKFSNLYYFPAYELIIDVLRDYRFYDIDLVHPNYSATQFVLEHFANTYFDEASRALMEQIRKIMIARNHKPFHPGSSQHKEFLNKYTKLLLELNKQYPFVDFSSELKYFTQNG